MKWPTKLQHRTTNPIFHLFSKSHYSFVLQLYWILQSFFFSQNKKCSKKKPKSIKENFIKPKSSFYLAIKCEILVYCTVSFCFLLHSISLCCIIAKSYSSFCNHLYTLYENDNRKKKKTIYIDTQYSKFLIHILDSCVKQCKVETIKYKKKISYSSIIQ